MSWSATFPNPVSKAEAIAEIDKLGIAVNDPDQIAELEAIDQLQAAKDAAKLLLKSVPGPKITVSLSGHANGVGWQQRSGWANAGITVMVHQSV